MAFLLAVLLVWNLFLPGEQAVYEDSLSNTQATGPTANNKPTSKVPLSRPGSLVEANPDANPEEDSLRTAAILPAMERSFPEVVQQPAGDLYQLGVYKKLESAEMVQTDLLSRQLSAHIDKRSTNGLIQYVVLLGPFSDPAASARVKMTLEQEQIDYFLRIQN